MRRSLAITLVLVGLVALAVAGALAQLVRGERPILVTA
jgi:hypothetical protein